MESCLKYIGNTIKIINNKINVTLTNEIQQINPDLTGTQYITLVYLYENKDRAILQKELEVRFELSHPTIVAIIKRLVRQNLVETFPYEQNKRKIQVTITETGNQFLINNLEFPRKPLENVETRVLDGFSPSEILQLKSFLKRIDDNLNN